MFFLDNTELVCALLHLTWSQTSILMLYQCCHVPQVVLLVCFCVLFEVHRANTMYCSFTNQMLQVPFLLLQHGERSLHLSIILLLIKTGCYFHLFWSSLKLLTPSFMFPLSSPSWVLLTWTCVHVFRMMLWPMGASDLSDQQFTQISKQEIHKCWASSKTNLCQVWNWSSNLSL